MDSLAGKVSVITGATSGMGAGVATKFSKEGSKTVLGGRNIKKGEEFAEQLSKGASSAVFVPGDNSDPGTSKNLVDAAISSFGRLDIVVMSAGRLGIGKITEVEEEDWIRTINVNLNSVFYLIKYAIPEMFKNGGGNIVIIGSVAAFHAFPAHAAYCASQGALVSPVRQVAADYGPESALIFCVLHR